MYELTLAAWVAVVVVVVVAIVVVGLGLVVVGVGCHGMWLRPAVARTLQDDVLEELAAIEAEEEAAAAAARAPGRVATADAGRDLLSAALDMPSAPTTPVLPVAPTAPVLPDAPTAAPRTAVAADPDLAELEALAAGMS